MNENKICKYSNRNYLLGEGVSAHHDISLLIRKAGVDLIIFFFELKLQLFCKLFRFKVMKKWLTIVKQSSLRTESEFTAPLWVTQAPALLANDRQRKHSSLLQYVKMPAL